MRIAVLDGEAALALAPVPPTPTHLDSLPATPADQNPALVYLASLSKGSRRTIKAALDKIAGVLVPGLEATTFPWARVRHEHVAAVRARLSETLAPATTNKILVALRGVLRAAFNLGLMNAEDLTRATAVKAVRGTRVPKGRALSAGEVRALFEVCEVARPGGARDAALLGLLYGGGLRRSEVVGLDVGDLDLEDGRLVVRGKGNKERTLYLPVGARDAIRTWLTHRGSDPGPLLLPINKGGRILRRRMSDQAVLDLVRRLAEKARVKAFSPHDFRRTAIGDLLDAGVDLPTVQKIAGHASPSTTSSYDRRGERVKKAAGQLLHVPFRGAAG